MASSLRAVGRFADGLEHIESARARYPESVGIAAFAALIDDPGEDHPEEREHLQQLIKDMAPWEAVKDGNNEAIEEARRLIQRLERVKGGSDKTVIFETGYGPSGLPHIGTFGEVARTTMVRRAFELLCDIPTRLLCFSDDMDGMRKIPDNVPSKAFGELVEEHCKTPRMEAAEVKRRIADGEDMIILDSRPMREFRNMSIPGGIDCPGAVNRHHPAPLELIPHLQTS